MPLKLIPPRGKSPYYYIRGTHLNVTVFRSAGTSDKRLAQQFLAKTRRDIESGALADKPALTFAAAALSYLRAGGEQRFMKPLAKHFRETPLDEIGQAEIDEAAARLYPNASAATRNRQVYTPISAILKHVGRESLLKRPKGHAGSKRTTWLQPEEAERLFAAATDPEFRAFLVLLVYTGLRLSEALRIERRLVRLSEAFLYAEITKNEDPRAVHLPPVAVSALANMGVEGEGRLFRFRKNGHLYNLMREVKKAAGLPWVTFHVCRHTYATWMRRYAGLDTRGLVGTGAWKSEKSAARYSHVVTTEEARRADLLPIRGKAVDRD